MEAVRRTYPLPGIELTRVENDTRLWSGHSTHYGISLTHSGAFDFWYRKQISTEAPGKVRLKEPGEVYRETRVHAPVTATSIGLHPELVAKAAVGLGMNAMNGEPHFNAILTRGGGRVERAALQLGAALAASVPDRFECESMLAEALEAILNDYAEHPPGARVRGRSVRAARRAREYLHAHLADNVGLEALALQAGLNKFYLLRLFRAEYDLLRLFRAEYGMPPHEYLTHLRVARARLLLAAGMRASQVAAEVGLCDQSQLNRHFKRITGVTAAAYARTVRGATAGQ